ncbi:putative olfactory receptor 2B3 [Dasypus novemcinctus]|uniref:putative olfactory receptor 2B3 n=1 Tax=Dasypus novemcinctus TaxID=9361 RepID=UPI00265EA422|nr:putative olfactory receptor 2B3 [Dasypus novemcinctus]
MNWANKNSSQEFILLGFSDRPWLQMPLLVVLLISYTVTIFGNVSIMMACIQEPKLHKPMYFFLTNLSVLDLCYTTGTVPHMLANICQNKKTINYGGCVAQLIIFLALGATECLLLTIIFFDRFVAICRPLHYVVIMSPVFCQRRPAFSWLSGSSNSMLQSSFTLSMPCFDHQEVDHFCEVPALLKLSCADPKAIEAELFFFSILILLIPVTLILTSYGFIVQAVLRTRSAEGWRKAFGICGSHLVVMTLFFGTAIYIYLQPPSSTSEDWGRMVSLFYGVITPMLNPLIYSLQSKDIKVFFKRVMSRTIFCKK